jgi:hypothetical protein
MGLPVKTVGAKPQPYVGPAPAGGSTNPGDWFASQKPQASPVAAQATNPNIARAPVNEGQNQWDFYNASAPHLAATAGAGMGGMKAYGATGNVANQIRTQLGPRPLDTPDAYTALAGRAGGAGGSGGYGGAGAQHVAGGAGGFSGGDPAAFEADMLKLRYGLDQEAEARRRGWAKADSEEMLTKLDPWMKPGAPPARAEYPEADTTAARTAAFARASDRTGQLMVGAFQALQDQLASRGAIGGGMQAAGEAAIRGQGAGQLGDVIREQAIQDADAAESRAGTIYSGNIQQRGQDISSQQQRLQMLPSLMALIKQGYSVY